MLKMKPKCEKCRAQLAPNIMAYICSFECTFCESCTQVLLHTCPNCNGELVKRPVRERSPMRVVAAQLKSKLFGR